jgi:hypothetical protein
LHHNETTAIIVVGRLQRSRASLFDAYNPIGHRCSTPTTPQGIAHRSLQRHRSSLLDAHNAIGHRCWTPTTPRGIGVLQKQECRLVVLAENNANV